jgi:hypothetical protein
MTDEVGCIMESGWLWVDRSLASDTGVIGQDWMLALDTRHLVAKSTKERKTISSFFGKERERTY